MDQIVYTSGDSEITRWNVRGGNLPPAAFEVASFYKVSPAAVRRPCGLSNRACNLRSRARGFLRGLTPDERAQVLDELLDYVFDGSQLGDETCGAFVYMIVRLLGGASPGDGSVSA